MKNSLALLAALLLAAPATTGAMAADPAAAKNQYSLKGRIADAGDRPLAGVRVGMRSVGAATNTDGNGLFTLSFSNSYRLPRDKSKPYDCVEIDKDGYLGQTVEIRDLSLFDKPLAAKLPLNPVTEDRAEFSRRMSMGYNFPPGCPACRRISH